MNSTCWILDLIVKLYYRDAFLIDRDAEYIDHDTLRCIFNRKSRTYCIWLVEVLTKYQDFPALCAAGVSLPHWAQS